MSVSTPLGLRGDSIGAIAALRAANGRVFTDSLYSGSRRVCARPAADPDPVRRRGTEHGANGGMRSSELPLRPAFLLAGGNQVSPTVPLHNLQTRFPCCGYGEAS